MIYIYIYITVGPKYEQHLYCKFNIKIERSKNKKKIEIYEFFSIDS